MNNNLHIFALFYENLSKTMHQKNKEISITEVALVSRIVNILRCKVGQTFIFFDTVCSVKVSIKNFTKKSIVVEVVGSFENNKKLSPEIYLLLPLLKREAFDQVLYACCELGVTRIQLIATDKCMRKKISVSEKDHMNRIMQAAAEQSKQFCLPTFLNQGLVLSLHDFFESPDGRAILEKSFALCAHIDNAQPWNTILPKLHIEKSLIITCGPEGDFTQDEKQLLEQKGFITCALGPTVLRAFQAITLLTGLLRTLL